MPAGVVNIVAGTGAEVGAPMVDHPLVDMVSFTGSTRVGKLTMAAAAQTLKKVSMELGGKNPQIVFPDADLEAAVDAAVFGGFFNAGECCNAGSRLIVHERYRRRLRRRGRARWPRRSWSAIRSTTRTKVGAIISPSICAKIERLSSRRAQAAGAVGRRGGDALASNAGDYLGADHRRRRHRGHGDRARGSVRPGAVGADLRDDGRGVAHRQQHALRSVGRRLERATSTPA